MYLLLSESTWFLSCPTLCDPIDGSPPGSPVPGILQARTLEWVAISFSSAWKWKVKVKSLSCVLLLATPWTAAHQAPPSLGFSRQEYWRGVPWPSMHWVSKWLILHHLNLTDSWVWTVSNKNFNSEWEMSQALWIKRQIKHSFCLKCLQGNSEQAIPVQSKSCPGRGLHRKLWTHNKQQVDALQESEILFWRTRRCIPS